MTEPSTRLQALFDLHGRVALITGGSRGLGLQVAEALGEYGATVVLIARKQPELAAAADRLRDRNVSVDTLACDLSAAGAVDRVADAVAERHGRLDILVNNAGATWGAPAEDYPLEGWNKVIDLNVTGLFLLTQAMGRRFFLPRRAGSIVNIASVAGLQGNPLRMTGTIAYNTAKGAVVNLTRALAAEWGPSGINVNAIAPGYFPSKMTRATLEAHESFLLEHTPLGRLGGPDDLKGAALLFASDAGRHITGQILVVDGGASVI